MPSFLRRAANLEALREDVRLTFGPDARIVEAVRVTRRGVGPWLGRDEIEATIEVPEGAAARGTASGGASGGASASRAPWGDAAAGSGALLGGVDASRLDPAGIAALLADADRGDAAPAVPGTAGVAGAEGVAGTAGAASGPRATPQPSTAHPAFDALLDDVTRSLGLSTAGRPARELARSEPRPGPHAGGGPDRAPDSPAPGDLVLLVGLGDDALHTARAISAERGWPRTWVRATSPRSPRGAGGRAGSRTGAGAGDRSGARAGVIADRRSALAARADALRLGREVILAHAADLDDPFTSPAALRPDRVWAVVDASRTPADTAEWVGRLDETLGVDAIAIIGTAFTHDRGTAKRLGFPVAWQELG